MSTNLAAGGLHPLPFEGLRWPGASAPSQANPPQGFAIQRVYTDDRSIDETIAVEDGDVVMVPRGYHPTGAPHGYDLYYLNVMAGPDRHWIFRNDPTHDWIVRK